MNQQVTREELKGTRTVIRVPLETPWKPGGNGVTPPPAQPILPLLSSMGSP